jgi:opacity protein-like surface antigen
MKSNAQNKFSKYEFGINAGLFLYQGDLTPRVEGAIETPSFGINIFANRIISPSFSLRTNLSLGSLRGDDSKYTDPAWRQQRNFNFYSSVVEVSESLLWNVLRKNDVQTGFSPYVYAGVGLSSVNIRRDASRFNPEAFAVDPQIVAGLQTDLETDPPKNLFVFPVGVGVKYWITPNIAINADASYRITFTDYLDGFSKAGWSGRKDYYYNHAIGFVFKFGRSGEYLDCPAVSR